MPMGAMPFCPESSMEKGWLDSTPWRAASVPVRGRGGFRRNPIERPLMSIRKTLLAAAFAAPLALGALAADAASRSSQDDAKALLEHAVQYLNKEGPEAAARAFNDPKGGFVRGDLY